MSSSEYNNHAEIAIALLNALGIALDHPDSKLDSFQSTLIISCVIEQIKQLAAESNQVA